MKQQKWCRDYYEGIHLLQDVSIWIIQRFAWLGVYFFLDRQIQEETQILFGVFWICVISLSAVLLRHFCHRLPLLLAGHGVFYAVILLLAREMGDLKVERTIFCLLLLTGTLIGSIQAWRRGFDHMVYRFPWYFIPEILIIYFYGIYRSDAVYQIVAFTLTAVFLLGHCWCLYLQGMNDYLDQNRQLEGIPGGRIFQTNTQMIVSILLCLLLVMILVGAMQFDRFSGQIGGYIAIFFQILIQGIQVLVRALRWWNHGGDSAETDGNAPFSENHAPDLPSDDLDTGTVFPVVFVSLLIFIYLVYRLAKAFDDKDDHEWSRPDYGRYQGTDDLVESIPEEEKHRFHLFRTNREKVRHQFKKRVQKTLRGHIPTGNTAWELTEELQKQEEKGKGLGLVPLTELYDVARYGNREITKEEVRKLGKTIGRK